MPPPPKKAKDKQPDWPWQLPVVVNADVYALQAMAKGIANEFQQKHAWDFITRVLCRPDFMSFYPGGEDGKRASDFAEGKRWVGNQLRRIEKLRPATKDQENA